TSVVEHLKTQAKYENLGTEEINGRAAVKYRFEMKTGPGQSAPATDAVFFLDETTGLPVRAEIVGSSGVGEDARILMEMRDVKLNPDPASFDVPIGYRKVPPEQVKQQLSALSDAMKSIADALARQTSPPSAPKAQSSQSPTPVPEPSPARHGSATPKRH
ncbi:MAG TPA: hypothetical protein VJX67_19000, partial [Blastocatellia bacterium]|nr:hypothetical protein [Blastocatellia bacterium]